MYQWHYQIASAGGRRKKGRTRCSEDDNSDPRKSHKINIVDLYYKYVVELGHTDRQFWVSTLRKMFAEFDAQCRFMQIEENSEEKLSKDDFFKKIKQGM